MPGCLFTARTQNVFGHWYAPKKKPGLFAGFRFSCGLGWGGTLFAFPARLVGRRFRLKHLFQNVIAGFCHGSQLFRGGKMPKIERKVIHHSSAPKKKGAASGGSIDIKEPDPPIQACDQILGHYLRQWNQIEYALFDLFQKLLGTHISAARIIAASGINQPTLRDIINALAGQRLTEAECGELENLLEREKKAATNRNKIVHGKWKIYISIGENPPHKATWERFYEPTDPRLFSEMNGPDANQKVKDAHIYSLTRIFELANNVLKLSREFSDFTSRVSVRPFLDAQPAEFSSKLSETGK